MRTNLFTSMWLLKANLIVTLFMYLASSNMAIAQSQNNIWSIPSKYLDHTTLVPLTLPAPGGINYNNQAAAHNHNAMQDAQGNLLFFIIDNKVYDKAGYLIDSLYYTAPVKGSAEICIIPDPGNCQRYYIALGGSHNYGFADILPYWGVLDLSLNSNIVGNTSRFGRMLPGTYGTLKAFDELKDSINYHIGPDNKFQGGVCFAASDLRNDNSRLLFVSNGAKVYRFKITGSGLTYDNYSVELPFSSHIDQMNMRAEMELAKLENGNYRIAVPYVRTILGPNMHYVIYAAELNTSGNVISSIELRTSYTAPHKPFLHGLEFSPNGNILYITHNSVTGSTKSIEYYDFINPNPLTPDLFQPYTHVSDAVSANFQYSQIELGKDGHLYFAASNRLAKITNPNSPTTPSWVDNVIVFSTAYQLTKLQTTTSEAEKTYILPDQIDGMDYTSHFFVNTECCVRNRGYQVTSHTQLTNASWDGTTNPWGTNPVYIRDQLVIPAGVSVNITNLTFKFAPGAKVVIERGNAPHVGGKLTMNNNAVFTVDTLCDNKAMWLGVQVYGHSNQNQAPTGSSWQGQLIMKSGSRIEHALKGAVAARYNNNTNVYPYAHSSMYSGYYGGIITASGATFLNNVTDVEVRSYTAPDGSNNLASFIDCNFKTVGRLNDPTRTPLYHLHLSGVKGVQIAGSTFINETPQDYFYAQQGVGIYSLSAGFTAKARCNNYINCTTTYPNVFQNLYRGISVSSSLTQGVAIDRNNFVNNFVGVLVSSTDQIRITRNNFQVYRSKAPNLTLSTSGINISASTGYKIEENSFTEYNSPGVSPNGNTYGIVVNNSGEVDNEIYKNTFKGIRYGFRAQGINAELDNGINTAPVGLRIKCNTFLNTIFDSDISVSSGRIGYLQGKCYGSADYRHLYSPAGNKFSHSADSTQYDIHSNPTVQSFNYAHHADVITKPQNYYSTANLTIESCYTTSDPVYFHNTASCPSKITDGTFGPSMVGLLDELNAYDELITELQVEADNLLSANSESTQEVLDAYLELDYLKSERNSIINSLIQVVFSDSTIANPIETIITILQNEDNVYRKKQLCSIYITINDRENATSLRNEIVEQYGYDDYVKLLDLQLGVEQDFITYLSLLKGEVENTASDIALDYGVINTLQEIANNTEDPFMAIRAQAYLSFATDTVYPLIYEELYRNIDVKSASMEEGIGTQTVLSIYPNPSDRTIVSVELKSTDMDSNVESYIEIYSITGQLASKKYLIKDNTTIQVDTSDLATGVYVVKLFSNNQLIETKKLMIKG